MHYIFDPHKLEELFEIRRLYELLKKVKLTDEPYSSLSVFFGKPNILQRNTQTLFLGKVKVILQANLAKPEEIGTIHYTEANLMAYRTIIATCHYILWQLRSSKRNSVLYRSIEDILGITQTNFLDDEDKQACFSTAKHLFNIANAMENANELLQSHEIEPFTQQEWDAFTEYLKANCYDKSSFSTPVTSITQPFFGGLFERGGAAVGMAVASTINNSMPAVLPTTIIGSTWLILGSATPAGVALLAPMIAAQIVRYFFVINAVDAARYASGGLGRGIGYTVGMPVDLTFNLLRSAFSSIGHYYQSTYRLDARNGIRMDGSIVIAGLVVKAIEGDKVPEGYTGQVLKITANNQVSIDGVLIEMDKLDPEIQLPVDKTVVDDAETFERTMSCF